MTTWTDVSGSSSAWTEISTDIYVIRDYVLEGYFTDSATSWNDSTDGSSIWATPGTPTTVWNAVTPGTTTWH